MWDFLNRNSGGIQALAGVLTVVLALGALVGVKYQVDGAERIQRAQSARDIYREYLNVAINKPEFATMNYCAVTDAGQRSAYEHFVEYMLYTAEQTIAADPEWQNTFAEALNTHAAYLCSVDVQDAYSEPVNQMLNNFRSAKCTDVAVCK